MNALTDIVEEIKALANLALAVNSPAGRIRIECNKLLALHGIIEPSKVFSEIDVAVAIGKNHLNKISGLLAQARSICSEHLAS